MEQVHSDFGTVLQPGEAAICWSEAEGFRALIPKYADGEVPNGVMVLAAVLIMSADQDWCEALLDEVFGPDETEVAQ